MKVYFVGAHSTGKTTLARYVSSKYDMPMLNEVARVVMNEMELSIDQLRSNIDLINKYQSEVFKRQVQQEIGLTNFVSDRSFDNIAYSIMHSTITQSIIRSDDFKDYIHTINNSDSIIFFVRPSKATMKNDGVRENVVWDDILMIDASVKTLMEIYGVQYIQINTPILQERIKLVENIIKITNRNN